MSPLCILIVFIYLIINVSQNKYVLNDSTVLT